MNRFQFWCGLACGIAAAFAVSHIDTVQSVFADDEKKVAAETAAEEKTNVV